MSSLHRQARVDELPPVRSRADVIARLSDDNDQAYPIFRPMTLTTLVLDGNSSQLDVWCCGHAAQSGVPTYTWNLQNFFENSEAVIV